MFFNSKFARIPSALMVLGVLAVGCGDDDDDKVTPKPDGGTLLDASLGDAGGGDAGGGGGGTAAPAPLTPYTGTLVPILATDTSAPIAVPHTLELLNPKTGKPYSPAVTAMTTAVTGTVTFNAPADPIYIWIKGVGADTYDTVIANASRLNGDKLLRISSSGTLSLANMTGGYTNKPDRAAVAGIVYWSPGGVRKGAIGCAKIFIDGKTANDTDQDQLYNAASGLPTTIDKQSQTLKAGRYYIANMTVGQHSLRASLDNGATFLGTAPSTFLVPFPRSEASSTTKAVLVQASIDVDVPANPTPATCVDPA
ncbi:MAG: hypothetical protein RLZZ450_2972 [Pseudomonadota bacterium]|jgi:hypothetical protein